MRRPHLREARNYRLREKARERPQRHGKEPDFKQQATKRAGNTQSLKSARSSAHACIQHTVLLAHSRCWRWKDEQGKPFAS